MYLVHLGQHLVTLPAPWVAPCRRMSSMTEHAGLLLLWMARPSLPRCQPPSSRMHTATPSTRYTRWGRSHLISQGRSWWWWCCPRLCVTAGESRSSQGDVCRCVHAGGLKYMKDNACCLNYPACLHFHLQLHKLQPYEVHMVWTYGNNYGKAHRYDFVADSQRLGC